MLLSVKKFCVLKALSKTFAAFHTRCQQYANYTASLVLHLWRLCLTILRQ
jgi:hypothetical protein